MVKLGGSDTRSIKTHKDFPQGLFISELVDNDNENIQIFLIKNYFENGAALFARESPDELQDFRNVCKGALDNISDVEVYGIIQFFVQRLRNYGYLISLAQARISSARIVVMDKPRTAICQFYEGKIVSVEKSLEIVKSLQALSPEKQGELLSTKDLGFPPLYRLCRCSLEGLIKGIDS